MNMHLTPAERKKLLREKVPWDKLRDYLNSVTLDPATAKAEEWRDYFVNCMKLQESPFPGLHVASLALAREYLMKKHQIKKFKVINLNKPSAMFEIFTHEIEARTAEGKLIVAVLLDMDDGFDETILESLLEVKADYHYAFFSVQTAYRYAQRRYRILFPAIKLASIFDAK